MLNSSERILVKIYTDLCDNLKIDMGKRMPSESILISSISLKSNDILRALKDSSMESYKIPREALLELLANGYIRNTEDPKRYAITAKGVWEVEGKRQIFSERALIDYIDVKYFNKFEKIKPLGDREKIIVLALLSTRAFSEKASADMRKEDRIKDRWLTVMIQSYDLLNELGLIKKLKKTDLNKDESIEHDASHILRHNVDLPKKTSLIYTSKGENKYFLNIIDDDIVTSNKVALLLKLVFEDKIGINTIDKIERFCIDMAYNNAASLFDLDSQVYVNSTVDDSIREAIRLVILS